MKYEHPEDMPAWRVGEFRSSADPRKRVLMVAAGDEQIAEYGAHRDFIRWVSHQEEVDTKAAIAAGFKHHGYAQGTKEGIAFHRGACWQAEHDRPTNSNTPDAQVLVAALEKLSERMPTGSADYTLASCGDMARNALTAYRAGNAKG